MPERKKITLPTLFQKVAANEIGDLGDISTLADPAVVNDLIKNRL